MIRFDSTSFGSVTINGQTYNDVLIIGKDVLDRDKEIARMAFGTSHVIGEEEANLLIKGSPEAVIIGTGQSGCVQVKPEASELIKKSGAELITLLTPKAIQKYNRLSRKKKVNVLIHVTC